ncbi:MAG: hypothetical protein ACFB0A_09630 [Croceivirga sp.]
MKKVLKLLGGFIGLLFLTAIVFGIVIHEPLPEGDKGPKADELAKKMLTALHYEAYQNTRFLEWSFQGGNNTYVWDKAMGQCAVKWGDFEIKLNLSYPKKSIALRNNDLLAGRDRQKAIAKALSNFNNDSFWLVAPYKVFDKGTTRRIVSLEDGSSGLLVTYNTGGTTPGDSYLWSLDSNSFPNSYKMWVRLIPIGGLEASWDDWFISESGAFLPKSHQLGPFELDMGNVRGYND